MINEYIYTWNDMIVGLVYFPYLFNYLDLDKLA